MKFLKSLPKEKLQKLILTAIISLVAIGAVFNFYVLKQIGEYSIHREEIQKLNKQITEAQQAAREEVNNTILREQIRKFITAQEQRMVDGDSFSWIVREMALLAEKHPIHVTGLNPVGKSTYEAKPQYELYSTRLEVTGTYDQLGKFVSELENTFPTCTIRSLGMAVADASKGECRINVDMTLLVHPKTEPEKLPADKGDSGKKKNA